MGKRSNFERVERDFYPTPLEAVIPLLPHLPEGLAYWEPCAGNGALVRHLKRFKYVCALATDIEPRSEYIKRADALEISCPFDVKQIITNPPWGRKILHPMIE